MIIARQADEVVTAARTRAEGLGVAADIAVLGPIDVAMC